MKQRFFVDDAVDRAAAARRRARDAAEAIAQVRRRIARPASTDEPVGRDWVRVARAEVQRALERSEAAHLDVAELYAAAGNAAHAERHRAEAQSDAARRAELAQRLRAPRDT